MRHILLLCTAFAIAPIPAQAQDNDGNFSEGAELLGEGTRLILRGLLDQLEPAAEGWSQLLEMVNDFALYEMPEMLPNGDIIIRRKPVLPSENGEVDL